ncbi:MAG TPA: hypothetical protein VK324_15925, partial [Tepidisphaeraceae bacterium]|nr:hypothetical protein [Tepidisphaeraceae bacterium]
MPAPVVTHRPRRLTALLLLSPAFVGCLVTAHNDERRTGNYVADGTFNQIQPGSTTQGWVEATLGPPDSKADAGGGVSVWKWRYTETRDSGGSVF